MPRAVFVLAAVLGVLPPVFGQIPDFTLTAAQFSPDAIAPGGTASSSISVQAVNGFVGTVDLTCQVSSSQTTKSPPVCTVSPTTVSVPGDASATITTTGNTSTVGYTVTITGTGPSTTHTTPPLSLTVLALTPQFTVTVQTVVSPSSVPAGNTGQAVVSVNPIYGYTSPADGVTLSCSSITPLVVFPPYCSFSYPTGKQGVVVNGAPATSTLTISTYGPVVLNAGSARTRRFYALWLPFPMLALVGLGAAAGGKRTRKAWGVLSLFVMSGLLLLMPACGNTTTTATVVNGALTPNNTYTLTIVGVDSDGVVSSNSSSTSSVPTVTLTVTSPPK